MEIAIQNVSMTYQNGRQAFKDLNLTLRAPSLVGLFRPQRSREVYSHETFDGRSPAYGWPGSH